MTSSLKRVSSTDRDVSPPPSKRRIVATTTNKNVVNFFKPTSKKEPEKITFRTLNDSLLIGQYDNATNVRSAKPAKIAAFDLDSTLIETKSGMRFARDAQDWKWWHSTVPARLRSLVDDGYLVTVVSNQAKIVLRSDSKTPKSEMKSRMVFQSKVTAVLTQLDLPLTVYAATQHDNYRKPRAGMWEQILCDNGIERAEDIDLSQCIFVGDAGGRVEDRTKKLRKDFACSDRDLATNISINYNTPEEFFLGEAARPFERQFDPANYLSAEGAAGTEDPVLPFTKEKDIELVLLCGSPGAGKSTFYWVNLKPLGHERVNQDIMKTRDKCMKLASSYIQEGKSVVVDNTNADVETRAAWIKLARHLKVSIRCILFTASPTLCEHNDTVRALAGLVMNPESRTMLPKMAFSGFSSRYREPRVDEGFEDIHRIDFEFKGTNLQRALWSRYWVS